MMRTANHTSGFTLLELLLVISLLALTMAGMYRILDNWTQRAVDRVAAGDMLRVQTAAEDYTRAHFDMMKGNATNTFVELPINTLKATNYLPSGYLAINTFKQKIRVFTRNLRVARIDSAGATVMEGSPPTPVLITTIEVVTVSDNPAAGTLRVPNKRLIDTAQSGGPRMGISSQLVIPGSVFSGLVTSMYNEWNVDLSALNVAGYSAAPDAQGGYLAAYGMVNTEASDLNNGVLYRVSVTGRPELNRMQTDLQMNGNRVESVGTVVSDKMSVTGNANFRGTTQGNTAAETAQAMTVEQAFRVDGAQARFDMKGAGCGFSGYDIAGNRSLTTGCSAVQGGEVQVVAENNNAYMTVGTLAADGSVITDFTRVYGSTDSRGLNTFTTVNGIDMNATTQIVAQHTKVNGGSAMMDRMQTRTMSTTGRSDIVQQAIAAQVSPNMGNNVTMDNLDIGNAIQANANIVANSINATNTLTLVQSYSYHDNVLTGFTWYCTNVGGSPSAMYCEPQGDQYRSYQGHNITEQCRLNGSGYYCDHIQDGVYNGRCTYSRGYDTSGHAAHYATCG